jgi:hypothetical protein
MKKFNKTGPMRLRRVIGNLRTQRRIVAILAVAAGLLPASTAFAVPLDLTTTPPASGTINGAIYSTIDRQPTGTGVFQPFLTYQGKGIEEGYNTSQGGNGQGFLDTKRVPQWNHDLLVGDLAQVSLPGKTGTYFAFELDANETGNGNDKRLLSIDQIRIYTSATDSANSVGDGANIDDLGKLRYAQNDLGSTANWVLIDASRAEGGSTSGSGSSDLVVYVPTDLFIGALDTDLLYFYTINGVNKSADAGYEEWSARIAGVPDGGSTLLLLGSALTALGFLAGRRGLADQA